MNAIIVLAQTLPIGWTIAWDDGFGGCYSTIRTEADREYIIDLVKFYDGRLIGVSFRYGMFARSA